MSQILSRSWMFFVMRRFALPIFVLLGVVVAQSQTIVFFEEFEGAFPGTNWVVGDSDQNGDPAFWDDVDVNFGSPLPRSGDWMGYCAGLGFAGDSMYPSYQSFMNAFMNRTVVLTNATNATLTFWFNIPSIETGYDSCRVTVNGTSVWQRDTPTAGWQQATISLNSYVGGPAMISFRFLSDLDTEFEGWYLDDILVNTSGGSGGGTGNQPNLTPHQREGSSDRIVVSRVTGTTTDDSNLQPEDTLYVDFAVINTGSAATISTFITELYVDGVLRNSWQRSDPVEPNSIIFIADYNLGRLAGGTHTIRIRTDSAGDVTESNESDNDYTKTIVISGAPDIRITPLMIGFNVTNAPQGAMAQSLDVANEPEEIQLQLSPEQKLQAASAVSQRLDRDEERVRVIVNLFSPSEKPRGAEWNSKARLERWQTKIHAQRDEVLAMLGRDEFEVRHRFENQCGFSGFVTRKGLEKLARHPKVASIEVVEEMKPKLAQGIPLMNARIYRSSYSGAGVAIAIADSGVDYAHPRLGGGGFPNAKVIGGYDFADNDADPMPQDRAHGTACAGIAAGSLGSTNDYIGGVAPDAKICALKLTSGQGGIFDDDIVAAWNWCVTHKNDDPANPILVINNSFGGVTPYLQACNDLRAALFTAANNAAAAGITLLVSAGNEGFCDSLISPACLSSVISVGAVYDAAYGTSSGCIEAGTCASKYDDLTCESGYGVDDVTAPDKVPTYSNTSSLLDLLAPSHRAYTTDIVGAGGDTSGDYIPNFGGTSAACPYAAGAVAALQSAARTILGRFLTPAEVRLKLTTTGDLVTDTKAPITKPRINLGRAIETLGQANNGFTIFNDGNAPLNVTSIAPESAASWITWSPQPPFSIAPSNAQVVTIIIDRALVPIGETTRRLLVNSNDGDENPYPGGVFITTTNGVAARLSALVAWSAPNRVVISWPTNETGFRLQATGTLPATSWSNLTTSAVVVGTNNVVTNNVTGSAMFFRLWK